MHLFLSISLTCILANLSLPLTNGDEIEAKCTKMFSGNGNVKKDEVNKLFLSTSNNLGEKKKFQAQTRELHHPKNLWKSAKKLIADYNVEYVRDKMLPMAAAAYGTRQNVESCLRWIGAEEEHLEHVQLNCQGHKKQFCAGFVGVSKINRAIILAFRGTDGLPQLMTEIVESMKARENSTIPNFGNLNPYFWKIYSQLKGEGKLIEKLKTLVAKPEYEDYELWITGHSLGGALAALAAADLVAQQMVSAERIKLVTFGQPRVGDAKWAAQMKKELAHYTYSIVHDNDVVPHVPPQFFKGYQHHNTEVFYATEGMMGSPEFCVNSPEENGENEGCSEKQANLSVSDHLHYFGYNVSGFGKSGCVEENGNEAQENSAQKHKASIADVYQEMHNGKH